MAKAQAKKIQTSDLEYHKKMIELVNEIRSIDMQINQLQAIRVQNQGAINSWNQHLEEKYKLSHGDIVNEDGTITKTEAED